MSLHAWSPLANDGVKSSLRSKQIIKVKKQDLRSALRLLKRHRDALPHLIQGEVPFSITAMRKREVIWKSESLYLDVLIPGPPSFDLCVHCDHLFVLPPPSNHPDHLGGFGGNQRSQTRKDFFSFSFYRESTWSRWNRRKNPQETYLFPIGFPFYFPWALFYFF